MEDQGTPQDKSGDAETADGATARRAGRGGLAIAGAKLAFILFGFVQQIILLKLLQTDGYGRFSLINTIVSIVNNVVVATSIQGVSRSVAGAPRGREEQAFRATLRIHVVVTMIVSVVFASVAGIVANLLRAPHVTEPLRLVALVVLLYGIYAPLIGNLNGRQRFGSQAALDTGYGALRTIGLALGAVVFARMGADNVLGACVGFITAAALIVPLALWRSGVGREGEGGPSPREYMRFLLPLAFGQICLNLLLQTDFLVLRPITGAVASAKVADALQGVYRSVQVFSFLPYQFLMSVTFILFPMLARARADGDSAAVRAYTVAGVRIGLVLTALMVGTVSGIAPHVLRLPFPEDIWTQGGAALRIHCLGFGAFSILGITCAALTSLGRERVSALLTLSGVAFVAVGCFTLVPRATLGPDMLVASATATACAHTVTATVGAFVLARTAGGFVAPLTLIRVLATLAICVAVGARLPWIGKLGTLVEAAGVFVLGVVVLIATGEIGKQDLARIKQVVGKKA